VGPGFSEKIMLKQRDEIMIQGSDLGIMIRFGGLGEEFQEGERYAHG
jgi:hypothetical protein